ncbi:MAG: hypothetical protein AAFR84_19555 [Pseudomonadota bacterium]
MPTRPSHALASGAVRRTATGALLALCLTAPVLPAAASPLIDGVWEGETKGERAAVSVRASLVGTLGEMTLTAKGGAFKGTLRCRYLLRLESDEIGETLRRENLSSPACPGKPELTLDPVEGEGDALTLTIAGDGVPDLSPAPLRRRVGPVPPSSRATLPENLDVLGASIGAARSAVEAILVDAEGYAAQADRTRKIEDEGYVAEIVHYARKPDFPDANIADDIIVVAYEGGADATAAASMDARAVSIRRHWVTHPDAKITLDVMTDAVAAKYGPGEITRFYDASGAQVDGMVKEGRLLTRPRPYCRDAMERSGREDGTYEQSISIPGKQSRFSTGVFALCGSFASAMITERLSSKTGLEHPVLDLHIAAYDLMNDEIWKRVAARLSTDLAATMERENPSTAASKPEL